MKIRSVLNNSSEVTPIGVNKRNDKIKIETFKNEFDNLSAEEHNQRLERLKEGIVEQGKVICQRCDIKQFKKYKEMITSFFDELVNGGFKYSKESKLDYTGKKRIYANIKKVNEHLDTMAQELLKEQTNQMLIIQSVEDIRGIILDIFM